MTERLKLLIQKRTSLKAKLTGLANALDKGRFDNVTLKLRVARLTELYHTFEDYNDELALLDPDDGHQAEFTNIQERFYSLAGRAENILNPADTSGAGSETASEATRAEQAITVAASRKRKIKLPEATLPTFEKFENWLSFKNAFANMIGTQSDLSEIDKLHYLKSALTGEAANKIKIFSVDGISYSSAWALLERSYEVKRILISRHLSLLINLPVLERETTSGLTKLADDAQQHIALLKGLGVTVGPEMTVHLLESKLPRSAMDKWEATLVRDEFPKPDQIYEFVYKAAVCASRREKAKASETEKDKGAPPAKKTRNNPSNRTFLIKTSGNCAVCKAKRHPLYLCDKFKQLSVRERIETVKKAKLCYNCLRSHRGTPCKFSNCTYASSDGRKTSLATISQCAPQLLTSPLVYIQDRKQNIVKARALLDTCATANFISETLVRRLSIPVIKHSIPIGAINAIKTESRGLVRVSIQSLHSNFGKSLTCLVVPAITDLLPSETFPRDMLKLPQNIRLADPEFHKPRPVELLIGSGATLSLFSVGQIDLSKEGHDLYLQKTRLGWVIAGGASAQSPSDPATCCLTSLEKQIEQFWEIEENARGRPKSDEEIRCETYFVETVSREMSGRYTVRLPFRETVRHFGESRNAALKRLVSLERKFNADEILKIEYTRVFEEHLKLKHMSLVNDPGDDGYYMPHHAVIKNSSSTTKVRIVFDASAKTSNDISLNDALIVGPMIQNKIFEHLVRFRTYTYVLTADIEKMYCQVLLHEDDRRYQRILWRVDGEIKTFQFNTLTFGVSSSPFLAIRTVQKLADDEYDAYPRAVEIIKTHLYVDDLLTGAETLEETREIRDEIIALLARGGFVMRQWASNDERIVNDLVANALHAEFSLSADCSRSLKTLGVTWNTRGDKLCYTAHAIETAGRVTKRNVLAEIAKIFDPIGLLGPIVLCAKKIMQDVWRCKLQWDESVPQSVHTNWIEFARQLGTMGRISFDRRLLAKDYDDIQFHGFCDASGVGYGACLYIRSCGKDGDPTIRLACARSRVAPLKTVTIPRLELSGALLLARLYREAKEAMGIMPNDVVFWCDSTIALHWIKTPPHLLKTFVANRVAEIREITNPNAWRHVGSNDNPADAISRGQLPRIFVQNKIWFEGPSWLKREKGEWPNEITQSIQVPELKKNICLVTASDNLEMFKKYSSFSKLLRIIAYCLRWRPNNKWSGTLCATEISETEIRFLKMLQATRFANEIKTVNGKKELPGKNRLLSLSPFADENGLLRVGGRLQKSQLTFTQKHPILLPSQHWLTDRIIRETHERYYHAGIQLTLYFLRQRFWILDGKNQVRKIV
ncbi:PREDICTED: uncharacterized protein LOC108759538 [Trachymyrmex cornetzi]|uniref:uncharacterized protein LOC108759538 n=1 Tax=Trachymyrmex cornetzi TaxID=471704 RepID=UPI00084F272A|nr:PREDICTED: uncharacterized protein LOC108759538 [Trachymyrmex cornetzi]